MWTILSRLIPDNANKHDDKNGKDCPSNTLEDLAMARTADFGDWKKATTYLGAGSQRNVAIIMVQHALAKLSSLISLSIDGDLTHNLYGKVEYNS